MSVIMAFDKRGCLQQPLIAVTFPLRYSLGELILNPESAI
jgi:hypothetical protein